MAGVNTFPESWSSQLGSILWLRWRLLANVLRSTQAKFAFGARVFAMIFWMGAGVLAAIGLGFASWAMMVRHRPQGLTGILWGLLLYWQLLPIVTSSAAEGIDLANLLRFPLTYRAYFAARLLYGSADTMTAIAILCLLGIGIGIGIALPSMAGLAALALFAFGVMNIFLARAIFAWIERWLAKRRTRELIAFLLLLLTFAPQFIAPALSRSHGKQSAAFARVRTALNPVAQLMPPELAVSSLSEAIQKQTRAALLPVCGTLGLALGFAVLLHLRLIREYQGENLSEGPGQGKRALRRTFAVTGRGSLLPEPIEALMAKELSYFLRSGPQWIALIVPVVMLYAFGASNNPPWPQPRRFMLPMGASYALLTLPQLLYNIFGSDGAGVQFYFSAPIRLRTVVAAKNLFHAAVFGVQIAIIWVAVAFRFGMPGVDIVCATIAWSAFAFTVSAVAGNLISVYSPKRVELSKFGRSRISGLSGLVGFLLLLASVGMGAFAVVATRQFTSLWILVPVFLLLSAIALFAYFAVLKRIDAFAARRRDDFLAELSKA